MKVTGNDSKANRSLTQSLRFEIEAAKKRTEAILNLAVLGYT
jgi:hypothetical protein